MVVPSTSPQKHPLVDQLLADLPRGQHANHVGVASQAQFESVQNLLATESLRFDHLRNRESKIFLGLLGGEVVTGPRLADGRLGRWIQGGTPIGVGDDRHHLLCAPSRGHKGRAVLVPNLLTLPASTSVVCIDPKGDLARISAWFRAEQLKQFCVVLDPFDCSSSRTMKYRGVYNPIDALSRCDRRSFVPNARLIGDSLVVIGDLKEKHWDQTACSAVTMLSAHVATHVNYAGMRNLVTVWRLASELATRDPRNPNKFWLEEELMSSDAAGGMIRAAARDFYDRTGGEFSSVLSSIRKHLEWISYECMHDCLVGDSIDLADLKRKGMSLYATLPAMRMGALSGWLRLITQMSLAACEEEGTRSERNVVMVLDEMHVLGRLQAIETAIAQIAGFQVKLVMALQNLSQLQCYEKNYETFIANAGTLQVLGCADNTTQNYISQLLGQAVVLNCSTHAPTYEQATHQAATGESWSSTGHPLLTPEEVGRFFSRDDKKLRQLVLRPGYYPMVLQRAFYDQHSIFEGRYDARQ